MQLINCRINYTSCDSKIYTTELKNSDYKIEIVNTDNMLKAIMQTSKSITDFKIEFYLKIDTSYTKYFTNGYQTWSQSAIITKDENQNKLLRKLSTMITKGSGYDYASEYDTPYNQNSSYGYCYLKHDTKNKVLLFASLNEQDAFCKFNYDLKRNVLKITRNFKGYTINKTQELVKIISIESDFKNALDILKNYLGVKENTQNAKKLICYNTFLEYGNRINDNVINDKIYNMKNICDVFMIGDGYSSSGYDIFSIDNKRFPIGFKQIVQNIHAKEMMAAIWVAPFALSPLAKSFNEKQNLTVKQNEKTITTCPFWGGTFSLDVTNPQSEQYLKEFFDRICNEWNFDIIYCDCMYIAGSVPTDNHTQAMLISKGIDLVRKFTQGKILILGGVPFLSAVGKCDYIAISNDSSTLWNSPFDFLTPEFKTSTKSNLINLLRKSYQNSIYPCAYSVPSCTKLKPKLISKIFGLTDMIVLTEQQFDSVEEERNVTYKFR